jgi:hypothetical protein
MKKKITREQMEFGDLPGDIRPDPSIQRKLERGESPYSKHPAMPKGDRKFDSIVASKRFKDVVAKFERYAGTKEPLRGGNALQRLMMTAMSLVRDTQRLEQQNKEYLERLAIDLVKKQMGVPEGKINYEAELVPFGGVGAAEGMQGQGQRYSDEEIEQAFEEQSEEMDVSTQDLLNFEDAFEKFDMERAKRRFMNSLIAGASKKGHYMFELVRNELERIDPDLANKYGLTMASMDYLYWLYPEDMVQQMAGSGSGQAGNEEVDLQTDPPTVKAKAINFPILVHELLKGTYDVLGSHGLPDDPRRAEMVVGAEDTLTGEVWDLRLGPIFWEKFLESYPDEIFEDDMKHIQNYLFSRFSMLSANEFLTLSKEILSGSQKGKTFLQSMVNQIVEELRKQEYDQAIGDEDDDEGGFATTNDDDDDGGDDDGGDIDWGSLLGGTGVSKK